MLLTSLSEDASSAMSSRRLLGEFVLDFLGGVSAKVGNIVRLTYLPGVVWAISSSLSTLLANQVFLTGLGLSLWTHISKNHKRNIAAPTYSIPSSEDDMLPVNAGAKIFLEEGLGKIVLLPFLTGDEDADFLGQYSQHKIDLIRRQSNTHFLGVAISSSASFPCRVWSSPCNNLNFFHSGDSLQTG